VSLVCAETLSIVREPGIDDMILGHGKEQISLAVVFDLRERTLVALKKNGTLLCMKQKKSGSSASCSCLGVFFQVSLGSKQQVKGEGEAV